MDVKDWLILKALSEEHNITRAAARLYITQPALTYRLKNLENEFGVRILDRFSTGSCFTPQGEYLLRYAEEMLDKLNATKHCVRHMGSKVAGTLRLGVSTVFAQFKIAPILQKYQEHFPDVEVILKTGSSTLQLPAALHRDDFDIVIVRGEIDWPEKKHIILEEPLFIISSHPIELSQLPHTPWIQYETAKLTKLDEQYYQWWQDQFAAPPPAIVEVNSIETCVQLVLHGMGWSILPKIHIGKRRSLFTYPLTRRDGQAMVRRTHMLYRTQALEHPAVKTFVNHMLSLCPT